MNHNDVITLKLVTGEEVVARFRGGKSSDGNSIKITHPLILVPVENGRFRFYPWIFTRDLEQEFLIALRTVITYGLADEDTAKHYAVQSGTTDILMTPQKPRIVV